MRAIVRTKSSIDDETLQRLLEDSDWYPKLDQEDPTVVSKRDEILDHIAEEDLAVAKATQLFTLYDEGSKSWAIVGRPSHHWITFRIKNPVSDRLKAACEKLVSDLQTFTERKDLEGIDFAFPQTVEVLEPNSQDHAYFGQILPTRRWTLAIRQRRTEFWLGVFALVAAVTFVLITMPPVKEALFGSFANKWEDWVVGNAERITTALVVLLTTSAITVTLHYFDLSRRSVIQWALARSDES